MHGAPRRAAPRRASRSHRADERVMGTKTERDRPPAPPMRDVLPLVNASDEVARWLEHYWSKLRLPEHATHHLAVTTDRQEFARWTGRRLNPMALGCYCFLPD